MYGKDLTLGVPMGSPWFGQLTYSKIEEVMDSESNPENSEDAPCDECAS
jgi:hypothetical protein